jgi:hypothetical protein
MGRWWNGCWGRMVRRDIWLIREVRWQVRARQGDSDTGREMSWDYAEDETAARAMVERLLQADGPGDWRELPTDNRRV